MNDIARKRAERDEDCRLWKPLDALEWLVEEIKAGRVKPQELIVHYLEEPDAGDGGRSHNFVAAGVSTQEHICLLNLALQCTLDRWRGL